MPAPTPADARLAPLRALLRDHLPRAPGAGMIVGPSHAVRWRHAIAHDVLPRPFETTHVIGEGGFPVWNRTIFGQIFARHRTGMPIFQILPDHRFGNSLYDQRGVVAGQFYNDHTHIRRELIRPEVDAVLYRHHVENLTIWRTVFGRDLAIFDWTQLMTASGHRAAGRHLDADGRYGNRAYAEWVACDRPRLGARSWPEAMLTDGNDRLRRLVVDRSLHPSPTGFFLLHHMAVGAPFVDALSKAEELWDRWLAALARALAPALGGAPVVLGGDSIWIATARQVLGSSGLSSLAEVGLHLVPGDMPPGARHAEVTDAVEPGAQGDGSLSRPHVIRWGAFARNVVAARHPANAHLAVPGLDRLASGDGPGPAWLADALTWATPETFVDAGADLSPTFAGIAQVALTVADRIGGEVS